MNHRNRLIITAVERLDNAETLSRMLNAKIKSVTIQTEYGSHTIKLQEDNYREKMLQLPVETKFEDASDKFVKLCVGIADEEIEYWRSKIVEILKD